MVEYSIGGKRKEIMGKIAGRKEARRKGTRKVEKQERRKTSRTAWFSGKRNISEGKKRGGC